MPDTRYMNRTLILRLLSFLTLFSSAILLGLAFEYPFLAGHLDLRLPREIPNLFGLHSKIKSMLISHGQLQIGPQYLLEVIRKLFAGGETAIGLAVLLFSVIIPIAKIVFGIFAVFAGGLWPRFRKLTIAIVLSLTKWSMGDVFIAAFLIVLFKAEGLRYHFTSESGLYYYAASAVASSLGVFLLRFAWPHQNTAVTEALEASD